MSCPTFLNAVTASEHIPTVTNMSAISYNINTKQNTVQTTSYGKEICLDNTITKDQTYMHELIYHSSVIMTVEINLQQFITELSFTEIMPFDHTPAKVHGSPEDSPSSFSVLDSLPACNSTRPIAPDFDLGRNRSQRLA